MSGVRIVEVGPRDGLQNEAEPVDTEIKVEFIRRLAGAGLCEIEATSFVSPRLVPQLADASALWAMLPPGPRYSALVPNLRGLERAQDAGVDSIALFTAASEEFVQHNIGMSITDSLVVFGEVIQRFKLTSFDPTVDPAKPGSRKSVRAYISTAFECPYSGPVKQAVVLRVTEQLLALGADEISYGDTIGVASPAEVRDLARSVIATFGQDIIPRVAWHFHDTWGMAVANAAAALDLGFRRFDSSAGGLGGCPFAPGAGGNLATEDLVYFLEREGHSTGIDLDRLARASETVFQAIGRSASARAQVATLGRASAS